MRDPPGFQVNLLALSKAVPTSVALFGSLLSFNLAQMLMFSVKPFSDDLNRRFNRWIADTWWGWCVTTAKKINRIHIRVTGDALPMRENAICLSNHQQMADIVFLMFLARNRDRLGDMKWMAKKIIKYVPGVGWGMAMIDCVFVDRDWTADRGRIRATFRRFREKNIPLWLVSFPEGTRITEEKLATARKFAEKRKIKPPRHVLVPRSKGFVAAVVGLRDHVEAVYDVTIGYAQGVPSLWQFIKGFAKSAHLHVRRYPIADLPEEDEALARWLFSRFEGKDDLLEHFHANGTFPGEHWIVGPEA